MSYIRVYDSRINWENEPSTSTPIDEINLNQMDYALYVHDDSLAQLYNNSIKRIDYNTTTKAFLFTYWNGSTEEVVLSIEQIPASFSLDRDAIVHMIDNHGTEYTADLKNHIYYIERFDIVDAGEATATTYTQKNVVVADVVYELPGTKYMQQDVTLSTAGETDVVFTNNIFLNSDVAIDVFTNIPGLEFNTMNVEDNACHIIFPAQESSTTATVRLYLR